MALSHRPPRGWDMSYFPSASEDATRSSLAHLYQGYSPNLVEGKFCELRSNGVLRVSLRVGLPLDRRPVRMRGRYLIRVAVSHPPRALFWSKDHGDPQGVGGNLLPSVNLGFQVLYLHHVGELVGNPLHHR